MRLVTNAEKIYGYVISLQKLYRDLKKFSEEFPADYEMIISQMGQLEQRYRLMFDQHRSFICSGVFGVSFTDREHSAVLRWIATVVGALAIAENKTIAASATVRHDTEICHEWDVNMLEALFESGYLEAEGERHGNK